MKPAWAELVLVGIVVYLVYLVADFGAELQAQRTSAQVPHQIDYLIAQTGTLREPGTAVVPMPGAFDIRDHVPNELINTARWVYVRNCHLTQCAFERLTPTGAVCNADLDGSGEVDHYDYLQLQRQYGWSCDLYLCSADLDGSGRVNFLDFAELKRVYGKTCNVAT